MTPAASGGGERWLVEHAQREIQQGGFRCCIRFAAVDLVRRARSRAHRARSSVEDATRRRDDGDSRAARTRARPLELRRRRRFRDLVPELREAERTGDHHQLSCVHSDGSAMVGSGEHRPKVEPPTARYARRVDLSLSHAGMGDHGDRGIGSSCRREKGAARREPRSLYREAMQISIEWSKRPRHMRQAIPCRRRLAEVSARK